MSELKIFENTFVERVTQACEALAAGRGIVLIDDEDRENEGDLIYSAEHVSIVNITKMINDCSGIICLCITAQKANKLSLKPMIENNSSLYQTAFTTSIEARHGVTTGVSAHDRWLTIQTAIKEDCTLTDLNQPGHVFPLIARDNGVLARRGHTEGSIDLVTIAGLNPSAVLCEIMNTDGTMKKVPELIKYAQTYQLPLLTIDDIYQYRMIHES